MVTDIGEIKHYRTETFKVFLFINFPYYSHLILLKVYQNQTGSLWIKETLIVEVIFKTYSDKSSAITNNNRSLLGRSAPYLGVISKSCLFPGTITGKN